MERAITERTKAILPVHLFGQLADMDGLMQVAKRYDLPVIEDSAQAIGSTLDGQPASSFGDMGFTFLRAKGINLRISGIVTKPVDHPLTYISGHVERAGPAYPRRKTSNWSGFRIAIVER